MSRSGESLSSCLSSGAIGFGVVWGRPKSSKQGAVRGTVLRAQSTSSATFASLCIQPQQQQQLYAVPAHPHKEDGRATPDSLPCMRAPELCITDGARTSQQQQQQQQQRLVRRMVISPPYDLRAHKPYTHPCSRTSTSCEVFGRGEPALTCCRDCSCPPEERDKPTPWYADVIF